MDYSLEVCAYNIQTCLIAEKVGAKRVELCATPIEGGTTPSYGVIKQVREKLNIQLYPLIRPRAMNHCYDADEWEIIQQDLQMCKNLGCDGISIGIQKLDGQIDADRMKRIVELAYPLSVTCNRAFDGIPDPYEGLEVLIETGCKRVLTSGLQSTALLGANIISRLIQQANERIIIMPGAGVRYSNIRQLVQETGAVEYHTSAKKAVINPMTFINCSITDLGSLFIADEHELKNIIQVLNEMNNDKSFIGV